MFYLDYYSKSEVKDTADFKEQQFGKIKHVKEMINGATPKEQDSTVIQKKDKAATDAQKEDPQIYGYTVPIGWTINERINNLKEQIQKNAEILEVDIPFLLKLYNEAMVAGSGDFIAPMALSSVDADKQPECCVGCHSCEKVCPQTIHIPEELAKFAKKMGR